MKRKYRINEERSKRYRLDKDFEEAANRYQADPTDENWKSYVKARDALDSLNIWGK